MKGIEVPGKINEHESDLYHAMIIESRANVKTLEFDHKMKTQMFNRESFGKGEEKNFTRLGYGKMVVFHDPTLPNVEDKKTEKGSDKPEQLSIAKLRDSIESFSAEQLKEMLTYYEAKGAITLIEERLVVLSSETEKVKLEQEEEARKAAEAEEAAKKEAEGNQ